MQHSDPDSTLYMYAAMRSTYQLCNCFPKTEPGVAQVWKRLKSRVSPFWPLDSSHTCERELRENQAIFYDLLCGILGIRGAMTQIHK